MNFLLTRQASHPVDRMLPMPKLFAYGLQHVLAMYSGAVAVPIIVAQALHLTPEQLIHLINADLFTCGIATILQTVGFWKVGSRIPMIQGVTFASVTPMIMIGQEHGITAIYGAIIVAGLFTFLVAPYFSRLIKLFPPVVTGTIIMMIGITLLPVAVRWVGGGNPSSPDFANPMNLFLAAFTLAIVVAIYRCGKGFVSNVSVLIGLICGTILSMVLGVANFDEVGRADWIGIITPFSFGLPTFNVGSIISMIIVMLVVMVETTGDCIAIGEIVKRPVGRGRLARCLPRRRLVDAHRRHLQQLPLYGLRPERRPHRRHARQEPLRRRRFGRHPHPAGAVPEDGCRRSLHSQRRPRRRRHRHVRHGHRQRRPGPGQG